MEVPSISGSSSSKRARAPGSVSNMMSSNHVVAHCLVDGCNADLSLCRDYHRRHKVCEMHSKTAKVTIGGREQRFCQQCSRFHSLVEFDEGKRSCRKRLDGHNRRRRKPQQETLPRNSSVFNSNIFSTQQASVPAGTLVSFGSPQMLTTSSSSSSSWAGLVKPDNNNNNDMLLYNHNHQKQLGYMESRNSFSEHNYNQFHLLRNSQSLVDHNAGSSGISHKIMFSDSGLNQVVDSDHALSLLSSAPPVTREFGLVQTQPAQPLPHNNMHYFGNLGQNDFFSQGGSKPPLVPATDSHGNDASTPHFPDMFQHGPPQGSPTSGSHQTLTFMWE